MKIILCTVGALACVFSTAVHAQDVTSPGNPITGGQMIGGVFVPATQGTSTSNENVFPSNAAPAFAIDNDFVTGKYRNFGEFNTGFVVTPSQPTVVSAVRFWTASDAPERDPMTFRLEGTDGDPLTGSYSLIASGTTGLDADPGRSTGGIRQDFPALGHFSTYRLTFPTVRNSATADSMQIGEVAIAGQIPEPSALSLFSISALGLLSLRRRRAAAE